MLLKAHFLSNSYIAGEGANEKAQSVCVLMTRQTER